ncbi:MAG: HAD family hydrolase [Cyanobacteria bacterium P01_D01_bin.105]
MLKRVNDSIELKKPDAVLFDTDNTLYDYSPANVAAIKAVEIKSANLLGITSDIFHKFYKQARLEIKERLGHTASSHSRLLYFQRMLELLGFKAQLLIALDLEQTFWRTFLANAPLFSGVVTLLETLQYQDIPIAIVTDLTAHIQLRKLTYFHLEETFDAVVTSEEVGADKPDRRNFELVLEKLGIVSYDQLWMIGDNPATDVIGGRHIGAITFQKLHSGVEVGKKDEAPDFTFEHFEDLQRCIKRLLLDPKSHSRFNSSTGLGSLTS